MVLPDNINDLEKKKFVEDGSGDVAVRTAITVEDIQIGAIEIKNATDDTRAVVKSDGTNNALVVTMNTVPAHNVTVVNGAGASAVNIQDGGNTITVDGTVTAAQATASSLKAEAHLYDSSTNGIGSTSNALDINVKSGSIANTAFGCNNASGGSAVNIQDGGNTITVDGTVNATCSGTVAVSSVTGIPTANSATLVFGQKATVTAGTRVCLTSGSNAVPAGRTVTIKALPTNTGYIYVGDNTVTSGNGLVLLKGDGVSLAVNNTQVIYIDSSVNAEGVSYILENA